MNQVDQNIECQNSVGLSTKCAMPKCIFSVKDVADKIVFIRSKGSYQYSHEFRRMSPAMPSELGNDGCFSIVTGTAFLSRHSMGKWPRTRLLGVSSLAGSSKGSSTLFRDCDRLITSWKRTQSSRDAPDFSNASPKAMYKGEGGSRVTGCWIDSGGGGGDIREGEEEGTGASSMSDSTSERSA